MIGETALVLAEIAASNEPLPARAQAMLASIEQLIPFDSAWVALAEPQAWSYTSVASTALDGKTLDHLAGPVAAHDIELAGANRVRPPMSPSDLPYPAETLRTWAECLLPAGYREGLGVALFGPGRRLIGHLTLLSSDPTPPTDLIRGRLEALTPLLGEGVDPMRSALATAQLVVHAIAGVILIGNGDVAPLPGFVDDSLLAPDAPLLGVARQAVLDGRLQTAFLWPGGAERAFRGFVRVTVVTGPDELGIGFVGIVLLSPAGPLRGLTARELEVLGLIIEGRANSDIALALVIAPRTVASHLEHILAKLEAPSRTLAAVRAERMGLYVPASRGAADHPRIDAAMSRARRSAALLTPDGGGCSSRSERPVGSRAAPDPSPSCTSCACRRARGLGGLALSWPATSAVRLLNHSHPAESVLCGSGSGLQVAGQDRARRRQVKGGDGMWWEW